jgi:hypothetical protein
MMTSRMMTAISNPSRKYTPIITPASRPVTIGEEPKIALSNWDNELIIDVSHRTGRWLKRARLRRQPTARSGRPRRSNTATQRWFPEHRAPIRYTMPSSPHRRSARLPATAPRLQRPVRGSSDPGFQTFF